MTTPAVESERAKVTVRIDALTRRRLVAAAERDRRPISSLARLLIADALAERERDAGGHQAG
jgi:hypothetical protein